MNSAGPGAHRSLESHRRKAETEQMQHISRLITGIVFITLAVAVFAVIRRQMDDSAHQKRFAALSQRYDTLEELYNEAVRRTAVTELNVDNGRLSVVIRTVKGPLHTIDTPFDPNQEIYVDYLVLNGRLWIRRIFDGQTPPENALVLDPELAAVDWDIERMPYGKAVYRRLSEGRWIITVTGTGSLGLAKITDGAETELVHAPRIDRFDEAR